MSTESYKFRRCSKFSGVPILTSECHMLTRNEYLRRDNNVLKILLATWATQNGLLEDGQGWCKLKWKQGTVLENYKAKMCSDFECKMRKEITSVEHT